MHHLDHVAVGLAQPHPFAAAGLVERLDRRSAWCRGEAAQIVLALGGKGEADEARLTLLGDMEVMGGIGAAHIERAGRALGAPHAEIGEELLHDIEIRRPEPAIDDVADLDSRHVVLPQSPCGCETPF